MSELKIISPLMDGLTVEKELGGHNGQICYAVRQQIGNERFVLKILSYPSSESKVQALLLSGAYPDEAAVHNYYAGVVEDVRRELDAGKKLAESGRFCGAISYQIEPQESGVGFDIYILSPRYVPLSSFLYENAITHLRAVNLGIDLCDALAACRDAGYLFENIKPENVFLTPSGRFLLGDLGLASLEDLQYASVPEEYLDVYAAPELSDITASPNTTMDLYAIGMLLFRIYNGNHGPFEDENTSEIMAEKLRLTGKPLPTPLFADYELASIILKACAAHPSERFQTPAELKQALVLYMQRNHVSDTLIAPPIVAPAQPLVNADEPEAEEDTTVRMTDAETLDEDFRKSFAPDMSGSGTEKDVDHSLEVQPKEEAEEEAPPAPPVVVTQAEAAAADAPAEVEDPDQMDLDAFLASIAEVVGEAQPDEDEGFIVEPDEPAEEPPAEPDRTYVDEEPQPKKAKKKEKSKSGVLGLCIILAVLILAIIAVVFFLVRWYFVEITGISTKDGSLTTDQVTIVLETKDKSEEFIVSCADQYGNAYPWSVSDNEYTFTGLTENTAYTVWVQAADRHRLTSASVTSYSLTTPKSTQILEFTAQFGESDGEVLLNFIHEGPAPEHWQLHYASADGSDEKTVHFEDTTTLITGLKLDQVYTFTLESANGVFLSGALQTSFEVLPLIQADKLNVSEISGKNVTLTWESGLNVPAQWTVTCAGHGVETLTQTVTDTTCVFTVSDFDQDYTFTVEAPGMITPAQLVLPANPVVLDSLKAELQSDGSVVISWETQAGSPAGGWYVSYGVPGSVHEPRLVEADGNSLTLSSLIPNATYAVELQPADGAAVFGLKETEFTTAKADRFNDYGVKGSSTFSSLWLEPGFAGWDYTDLRTMDTYFNVDDSLVVCLEVLSRDYSDDIVDVLYVVRDSNGVPVTDAADSMPWDDLWYKKHHASVFPNPGELGDYTLELYINGQLYLELDFHII